MLRSFWDASNAEVTFTPYAAAPFDRALLTEHVVLVAEEEERPVGAVYANVSSPDFGYVFGLFVAPAARGRGVGRRLMRSIAQFLTAENRHYVVLTVDTPNARARAFYERLGFVDAARVLRADVDSIVDPGETG